MDLSRLPEPALRAIDDAIRREAQILSGDLSRWPSDPEKPSPAHQEMEGWLKAEHDLLEEIREIRKSRLNGK